MVCEQRGAALIDVVCATALLVVLAGVAIPLVDNLRDRAQVKRAARYLASQFQAARSEALARNRCVAFRVSSSADNYSLTLYADGDGDGVLERDIEEGIDLALGRPDRIVDHFATVSFGLSAETPDIDHGEVLPAGTDPIRIGRSSLISFGPLGSTTSGTLFLVSARGAQPAVRLFGATGRIRTLWLDPGTRRWRSD